MWIWTLDDRLVNLDVVESLEVIEVYPDDVDQAQLEAGAAEPDLYELVAVSSGGVEYVLYDTEDPEALYQVFQALAEAVAGVPSKRPNRPVWAADLVSTGQSPMKN
jgi:hypothetical protein